MQKILILNTGGTFNKVYNQLLGQLEVSKNNDAIEKIVSVSFRENVDITIKGILYKDSLELTDADREIMVEAIKDYEKIVAKQVAIPFYIYSSKVLQTRPDGNGVFLQSAENNRENGYLRFVSNLNDDHDAWNTMSSGQLSGLVISFMLAMNKVYPTKLTTILIDDPVQTMDEINLASFGIQTIFCLPSLNSPTP